MVYIASACGRARANERCDPHKFSATTRRRVRGKKCADLASRRLLQPSRERGRERGEGEGRRRGRSKTNARLAKVTTVNGNCAAASDDYARLIICRGGAFSVSPRARLFIRHSRIVYARFACIYSQKLLRCSETIIGPLVYLLPA